MEFEKRKAAAMAALAAPSPDKSPKGAVDAPVVPLLDALNRHPAYFTTSSCSGRISILAHGRRPSPSTAADECAGKRDASKKKAGGGCWLFVNHDPADPDAVVDLLFGAREKAVEGDLVFRFEPLIVAVECRDVAAAQALVSTAISSGFRESGITNAQKRVMVAIRCSIRMEVPLGQHDLILVPKEYVRYLVTIANDKMEANRKRTESLLHVLLSKGLPELSKEMIDNKQEDLNPMINKSGLKDIDAKPNNSLSAKLSGRKAVHKEVGDTGISLSSRHFEEEGTDAYCNKPDQSVCSAEVETGDSKMTIRTDPSSEISGTSRCSLSVVMLKIIGEPIEKLSLWGQSACVMNSGGKEQIIVFGGFGGLGRHARRDCSLILDPESGLLREIEVTSLPSPRLGHTSSLVKSSIFVIGGRTGPSNILNEVWILETTENRWHLLECGGHLFEPRHRHATASIGSKIYVFGGVNNEVMYSCMNILDTQIFQWSKVRIFGEWPCARHSHSMVAIGSQLFMFGGYDGAKALGDLYSFDVKTLQWKLEKTTGRPPFPRFSHSMFVYKDYLGIIGGCPVRQQYQELSLLNMINHVWVHVTIHSFVGELWVRSSTCIVCDELVIIGGGASCYAFGTKFNYPMKLNLQLLDSICDVPPETEHGSIINCNKTSIKGNSIIANCWQEISSDSDPSKQANNSSDEKGHSDATKFVLQIAKRYAKLAKDVTKKFGWLDLSRKVQPSPDGCYICLPITRDFHDIVQKKQLTEVIGTDDFEQFLPEDSFLRKGLSVNEVSLSTALSILLSCGGSLLTDDAACSRKLYKSPRKMMRESICSLLMQKGMPLQLLEQLPARWEHLGDIAVLPKTAFKDPIWDSVGKELWPMVAKSLGAQRLARQGRILPTGTRDSTLEILLGDNGWVTHQENGIIYSFDATKCMFSSGNLSEKHRMAQLDCADEIVVDLFAGIGYFVLPFLVKAKAKLVYACEWNPHAIEALQQNIHANSVADRCITLEGDNRITAPKGVADRVCLGLLPSSECSWVIAVRALRAEGGILHVHGNVNDSEEDSWLKYVVKSISSIAHSEGLLWDVSVQHLERVKWYGPHIRHVVADVRCKLL